MSTALEVTRVKVEHEHFIPVSRHRIERRLLESIANQGDHRQFADFCKLIEAIYHFEYHDTAEELKRDFRLFNPTSDPKEAEGLTDAELDRAEEEFLTNFMKAMDKGNFTLLTQGDYDTAEAEDFLFNLPVKIDLDKLDDELLPSYFAKHAYGKTGEPLPEFARRILIFRRGVGVEKVTGRLILQKIDILVDRTVAAVVAGFRALFNLFRKKPVREPASPSAEEIKAHVQEADRDVIFAERYIERVTPRHVTQGVLSLFQRSTIQEPTFQQLVILFRYKTPPAKKGKPAPPKDRCLQIKTFRDIPMADLEVIFPEKKLSVKLLDRIKLFVTLLIGVALVVYKLITPDESETRGSNALLFTALAALGGYCYKVYYSWKVARNRYEQLMTQSLYTKNLDNNVGVIFYLMDSLEEQEFKEAVLAYYSLWKHGPMSAPDVDGKCEQYLKDAFDVEVNFEIDDALQKLQRDKLVTEKNGIYTAVPLPHTLQTLDDKWDNFFKFSAEQQEREPTSGRDVAHIPAPATAGLQGPHLAKAPLASNPSRGGTE